MEVFDVEIRNKTRKGLVNQLDILQQALLCEGGNDSCVTVALFIVWRMLMLKCVTEREEDSRNRNNKHDFKGENVIFVTVVLFVF